MNKKDTAFEMLLEEEDGLNGRRRRRKTRRRKLIYLKRPRHCMRHDCSSSWALAWWLVASTTRSLSSQSRRLWRSLTGDWCRATWRSESTWSDTSSCATTRAFAARIRLVVAVVGQGWFVAWLSCCWLRRCSCCGNDMPCGVYWLHRSHLVFAWHSLRRLSTRRKAAAERLWLCCQHH